MAGAQMLSSVDRIYGLSLNIDNDSKRCIVNIQYIDREQQLTDINIPLLDALYLQNILEAMSKARGYDHLRQLENELKDAFHYYYQLHFD